MLLCALKSGVRVLVAALLILLGLAPALPVAPGLGAGNVAAQATPAAGATPVATTDPFADVLPADRDAIRAKTADRLQRYTIEAVFDPAAATITGSAVVTFRNLSPDPLPEVYFRLYPNADYYGDGGLAVGTVLADGAPVPTALSIENTALRVSLPAPLPPDGSVILTVPFVTTIPADSQGSYGIFNYASGENIWVLADWHPVLAVYEAGGWNLAPPTPAGDPTYAASSLFSVSITAPDDLVLVTSGVETGRAPAGQGQTTRVFTAGPAREFTLAASSGFVRTRVERAGVAVNFFARPGQVSADLAEHTAAVAADALAQFSDHLAPYPFVELDLVETPLKGALAVSWAGVIFLDSDALLGAWGAQNPVGFDDTIAHEVSHLWWGSMVGSDSNQHAFINEGLATVSSLAYFDWTNQPDAERDARETFVLSAARSLLAHGDAVADLPADAADNATRSWAVYGKGSLGFLAIERQIGSEAFWTALKQVSEDDQFGLTPPDVFLAAFEKASGQDLDALWQHWFNETDLTLDEINSFAD